MKILLAIEGSDFSEAAVREVAGRPWPPGSEVKLISVVEPGGLPGPDAWVLPDTYLEDLEEAEENDARSILNDAVKQLLAGQGTKLKVTTKVIRGYPKQAILAEAEAWGADLIVVGSHGYGGFKRLLLGSVSQAIASQAKCAVEIVHSRQTSEGGKAVGAA